MLISSLCVLILGCQKEEIEEPNTNPFEGIYIGTGHSIRDTGDDGHPDNIDTTYFDSKTVSIEDFYAYIGHSNPSENIYHWLNYEKQVSLIDLMDGNIISSTNYGNFSSYKSISFHGDTLTINRIEYDTWVIGGYFMEEYTFQGIKQ